MSVIGAGTGAVVRQGHLRKLKTMKKKFFVLRAETPDCSARLEYYESEKKFKAGASPRRVLTLKSCFNIMRRLDLKQKHVIALFTREEQFCVVAENEQDLHAWLSAILKQHRSDDASEELLHPIQHVWQVNVQKKGLGSSKNIHGLYNLCLTDKTLALVKIKSHNNVISDLGIPERVEYSLKNIRRCGDSECFFYMEVGRQTATGAGELWMLSDDSNIAQSMHSTIYHAMRNCAKENEHEKDHIVIPKNANENTNALPARRQTFSNGCGITGLCNERGLCVSSCIRQCVCHGATVSVEDSAAAIAPLSADVEYQPSNNTVLTDKPDSARLVKHHRTVSLPTTGYPLYQGPLKIVHERTRSAPLTGDELDRVIVEKAVMYSSCKAINGNDMPAKKMQWSRRASTGARLSKLSPAHTKNPATLRIRCESMPSRGSSLFEVERPPPKYPEKEVLDHSRDETDCVTEWYRTPRIPEEPDCCETSKDFINPSFRPSGSIHHSRTSSLGLDDTLAESMLPDGYLHMGPGQDPIGNLVQHSRTSSLGFNDTLAEGIVPDGYLPMAPCHDHLGGLISASSGSVCSGTPSTDPRFSEYQLEPATSYIGMDSRPPRSYSVGSRPPTRAPPATETRHRAYSVGTRNRPAPLPHSMHSQRSSAQDHMELDFSNNSPAAKMSISRTPPICAFNKPNVNEYVDMSPRNANVPGYVDMRPGDQLLARTPPVLPNTSLPAPTNPIPTPDGYVEMSYGRAATRPITIAGTRPVPLPSSSASPPVVSLSRKAREPRTPEGSQTLFPMSLDSPASPDEIEDLEEDPPHHPLTTVREISEDGRRSPTSSSPQYVTLVRPARTPEPKDELSCNPTANKTIARVADTECRGESSSAATVVLAGGGPPVRFEVGGGEVPALLGPLNYAALDLEPRRVSAGPPPRAYTQIDFIRSEKLHAADGT